MKPFKILKNYLFPNRLAAAKEKERRNQELKDALEESERKMQEVEIITITITMINMNSVNMTLVYPSFIHRSSIVDNYGCFLQLFPDNKSNIIFSR